MASLTDFIVHFGNVIELDFPHWNLPNTCNVLKNHPGWVKYQPQKQNNNRYGLSVTSLDGGFSGDPDLYSLKDYRELTGKNYHENDFKKRTNIVNFIPELNPLLDFFEPNLGRVHFLRLDKGGYFPPHRDNGLIPKSPTFRILVPISNFNYKCMKWIQNENILHLDEGRTYFINTTQNHCLFSFVDDCIMLVLNILDDEIIMNKLARKVLVF